MTEETAQPSETQEVAPSLDDVINEFQIEPQPAEAPAEPQSFTPQTNIDMYDENSVRQFVDGKMNAHQQELSQVKGQLAAMQQRDQTAQTDADIQRAVSSLTTTVEGLKPELAEAFLEMKARKDASFADIWNNRHSKPLALEKAMTILANEAKDVFAVQTDPQLVENQRAMQQSMQTNTNLAPEVNSLQEKLDAGETLEDRDRMRRAMMDG